MGVPGFRNFQLGNRPGCFLGNRHWAGGNGLPFIGAGFCMVTTPAVGFVYTRNERTAPGGGGLEGAMGREKGMFEESSPYQPVLQPLRAAFRMS